MLRYLLCGALIGAGAILPGVSGGVLAVVFGIYRPFMEVLTHPRRALPKYWRMLIPLSIGWAAGFLGFAKGIAAALSLSDAVTTWLFIGLIGGLAGIAFSFLISLVINRIVAGMGMEMTLSYIPAWLAASSVVFAVFVGMASGFFPALRAMRLSPLAAIRRG